MNERIKELARHADAMAREIVTDLREIPIYNRIRDEKFAELIVQECAGVGYDASYYECALNVSNKIKEHFGVEE
jgi:hypothetical protein